MKLLTEKEMLEQYVQNLCVEINVRAFSKLREAKFTCRRKVGDNNHLFLGEIFSVKKGTDISNNFKVMNFATVDLNTGKIDFTKKPNDRSLQDFLKVVNNMIDKYNSNEFETHIIQEYK